MKKTLLYVLLAGLAMVFAAGCGEKKKDETPNTPINASDFSTLKGNYEIQAFLNSTDLSGLGMQEISFVYNCNELKAIDNSTVCDPAQDVQLASQAVISGDNATNMVLETKVQMQGGSFGALLNDPAFAALASLIKDNAYSYTMYGALRTYDAPAEELPASFTPLASATGVSGRNMTSQTGDANSDISFFLLEDGRIVVSSFMVVSDIPTGTAVLLKKINDATPAVNPNELVNPNMAGFDASDFRPEVVISGTYTVSFFGTQVTNPVPTDPASQNWLSMTEAAYISNNCTKAVELYPAIVNQGGKNICSLDANDTTLQKGIVSVLVKDGKISVVSKMEMTGALLNISTPDKYQFTTYSPVNFNGETSVSGTGVKGFNYDETNNTPSATETDFATTPFTITFDGAGNIDIAMTLTGKTIDVIGEGYTVDAVTRVQATKTGPYEPIENRVETDLTVTP